MPTPVSTARQCLMEEAARALDDAVAVARRRSHAQTTSLHAVSALLSMPSSVLRDVCMARARSSVYSSRLQFRALELCVGVSLDRLPSSKSPTAEEEPPVSNSLMAAIKRSQANQRRHPESYHLQQIHNNGDSQTTSVLKVELKYFILSILDDPIVSRVFGEAGFRSCDIKLDVLHPPVTQFSPRFPRTRCPPLFLCNLTDSEPGRAGFGFPFHGSDDSDENWRRIGKILGRKEKKNLLLVGVCASNALKGFVEAVERGKLGFLPSEISGLSVISIEKEISEFLVDGSRNEEDMGLKLDELAKIAEQQTSKCCLVVNLGDLKALVGEAATSSDAFSYLILRLTNLLKTHERNLWLIGSVSSNETYSRFLDRFPTIDKDWNLHLLPITSSKPSCQGIYPKSSLMGSFVPFGGFFSTPSAFKNPFSSTNQSLPRCHLCNEKYEQEVAVIMKAGSTFSIADHYSENLPSWLRVAEPDVDKGIEMKAKDDRIALNSRITGLQKKWNDICQRLHQTPAFPKLNISPTKSHFPIQFDPDQNENSTKNQSNHALSLNHGFHVGVPEIFQTKQKIQNPLPSPSNNVNSQSGLSVQLSKSWQREDLSGFPSNSQASMSPITSRTTSSSISSIATDLGLGTIYASASQESNTPKSLDKREFCIINENSLNQTLRSSSCSGPISGEQFSSKDFKSLKEFLSGKVGWQNEAVSIISEIVSQCRAGYGTRRGSISFYKGVWLTFLGPDKIGKKKIASALADVIFGSQENLISVDFSAQDSFDDKFRGKTAIDYVASELARKPHSVVFLENVDKAELPDRISLSDALRTGKLRDSHGREISTNSVIVVATSSIIKDNNTNGLKSVKFSEERILRAMSWKMLIEVVEVSEDARTGLEAETSNMSFLNKKKREMTETEERILKARRSYLDLNLPVEETEENTDESDSISENTEVWLEDFLEQVDGKVVFKPFDFDGIAQKIKNDILFHFHRNFGYEKGKLEIDEELIVQLLAASWSSDKERSVDDWLQNVLGASFGEARRKYGLNVGSVVKLVACKGCPTEEQAPGIRLPGKIDLH